jgi:anti-sigma regulatory factor (Ser/Thr protein kinase)
MVARRRLPGRGRVLLCTCGRYVHHYLQSIVRNRIASAPGSALDDHALEAALCSHPLVVDEGEPVGSTRYGGLAYAEEMFGTPLPEPAAPVGRTDFGAGDLAALRARVRGCAREVGLGEDRTADLVLAVTELATNSVRHGGGGGRLRTWRESDALVVEVTDGGQVSDPLAGRRTPSLTEEGGRGLWLPNHLCDLVQLRSGPDGTVVRVFALPPGPLQG